MVKHYQTQYDTFNEFLFRKLIEGGSLQSEINWLRKAARDYIKRAVIAREASNVIALNKALQSHITEFMKTGASSVLMSEIIKRYDVVHDDLFIVAAFENYAKAELLGKRYVVHVVNRPPELRKLQEERPLHMKTLLGRKYREKFYFSHFTIGMRQLLQPDYLAKLDLSKREIAALQSCRGIRNSIHFGGVRFLGWGDQLFRGIDELYERLRN